MDLNILFFCPFHLIFLLFFGEKINARYYKTSSKNRKNIDNAIVNFIKQIIYLDITNKDKTYVLDGSSIIKEKKECCSKKI